MNERYDKVADEELLTIAVDGHKRMESFVSELTALSRKYGVAVGIFYEELCLYDPNPDVDGFGIEANLGYDQEAGQYRAEYSTRITKPVEYRVRSRQLAEQRRWTISLCEAEHQRVLAEQGEVAARQWSSANWVPWDPAKGTPALMGINGQVLPLQPETYQSTVGWFYHWPYSGGTGGPW